jgi:large subunit ribosomal protein L10
MIASAIQAPVRDFAYVVKAVAEGKDEEPAA